MAASGIVLDTLDLLRGRDFRLLFLARMLSVLGAGIAPIALAFGVLALPGATAGSLGAVMTAGAVVQVVFTLGGGVVADRVRRSRVIMVADALAALAHAAAAALFLSDRATVGLLAVVAAVGGLTTAMLFPALTGIVPEVAPADRLQSANALLRLATNVARIGGTVIGGLLVVAVGSGWAMLVAAVAFALSAALVSFVRGLPSQHTGATSPLRDLRAGWREFTSRRWVVVIVVVFSVVNMAFMATFGVLGPVLAQEQLGGARPWAVILAAEGAGTLVGVFVALWVRPARPMLVCMIASFIFCVPLAFLAIPTQVWLIAVAALLAGVAGDVFGVLWDTALQQHVPAEALSRVSSYDWMGSFLFAPLGLAVAGPLADAVGVNDALWWCFLFAVVPIGIGLLDPQVRGLRAGGPAADRVVVP